MCAGDAPSSEQEASISPTVPVVCESANESSDTEIYAKLGSDDEVVRSQWIKRLNPAQSVSKVDEAAAADSTALPTTVGTINPVQSVSKVDEFAAADSTALPAVGKKYVYACSNCGEPISYDKPCDGEGGFYWCGICYGPCDNFNKAVYARINREQSVKKQSVPAPVTTADASPQLAVAPPIINLISSDSESTDDGVPLQRGQTRLFPPKSLEPPPPAKVPSTVPDPAPPARKVPSKGDRVEVLWEDDGRYYPCVIKDTTLDNDGAGPLVHKVQYEDGFKTWHNMADPEMKWRVPPAASSSSQSVASAGASSLSSSSTTQPRQSKGRRKRSRHSSKGRSRKPSRKKQSAGYKSRSSASRSHKKKSAGYKHSAKKCNHRQVFLQAEPSSLILDGGTRVTCPSCDKLVWVCSKCYRAYVPNNEKYHLSICVGSNLALRSPRYREAVTGKFREGHRNPSRTKLRGAPPDPSGLLKLETTLTPSIPPDVYRNAYVAGSTPCVDYSRLSPAEVLFRLHQLLHNISAGTKNLIEFQSARMTTSQRAGDFHHVVEGGSAGVTQAQMFNILESGDPCYITIAVNDMSGSDFKTVLNFAPPPRAIQGFLYRRIFVFVSRCDEGAVIFPHRDQGGGPLVFAVSEPGGRTLFAVTGPTAEDESADTRLRGAFDHLRSNQTPNEGLHYVSLARTGDYISVPSGYWHTVMSQGLRICVSYFDRTLDKL